MRLDEDWSLLASFQYARASANGGLSGLRFSGTIDPTWHATRHLSLALGLGFGGIVEGEHRAAPRSARIRGRSTARTRFRPRVRRCRAAAASALPALARAEWTIVLGPRSATSFALEAIGQWTGCVDDTGTVEPDTGQAIVRRQWWPHAGVTAIWGMTWR